MNSRFVILNPCHKRWDELEGDGRRRHCATCNTPVHSIDEYSPKEWEKVWRENGGRVCGYREVTYSEPPRSRRTILFGALLSFVSPLFAQNSRLRVRVTDANGHAIPGAHLELSDGDKVIRQDDADARGEIAWNNLPMGRLTIKAASPGFNLRTQTVTLSNTTEQSIQLELIVGTTGEIVQVEVDVSKLPSELDHREPIGQELDTGHLRVRATDATGASIPAAQLTISDRGIAIREGTADANGEIVWDGLPLRDLTIKTSKIGFENQITAVSLSKVAYQFVTVRLSVGTMGTFVEVKKRKPWWKF